MQAREIVVTKIPVGLEIAVRRENLELTSIVLEFNEWDWVKDTADNVDMGQSTTKTFVL